jgi:uncharacterized RDD family membrane protein YckC
MNMRLSPRRLVSLIVTLLILAIPSLVAVLTFAGGTSGTKGFGS